MSPTSHRKELLYAQALQAHKTAIEAYIQMNQLIQKSVEIMVKKRNTNPTQIMNWSQNSKFRSLENVAKMIEEQFVSIELLTKYFVAQGLKLRLLIDWPN